VRRDKSFLGLAKRSFAFWFGGIWLFCGAPFLIVGLVVGVDTLRQHERFENEAESVDGMVLTKRITRNKNNNASYWVGYRFRATDGTVIRNEAQVSGALWDRLVEREPVRVTYLPSEPRSSRIEGAGVDWALPGIFTLLGLVFVPIGGVIFVKGVRGILRELRLQSEGTLVAATVTEVEPSNISFNGVPQWLIRYRYQDHRGRTHTGESSVMPPEEAQAWKPGDTTQARFDPNAPTKSIWVGRM
jgi:hypothetical protein